MLNKKISKIQVYFKELSIWTKIQIKFAKVQVQLVIVQD